MKFLYNHHSDFGRRGRFISLANRLDAGGSQEEIDLSNPLKVSLSDISHLASQANTLEADQIRQLNQVVEYHLSLIENETAETFPSRTLWEIARSELMTRISPVLQMKLRRMIRIKRDELAQFAMQVEQENKPLEDLSDHELIRMTRAYRHLLTFTDKDTQRTREALRKRMLSIGAGILAGYEFRKLSEDEDPVLVAKTGVADLTPMQRVWVLEIYRAFPSRDAWPHRGDKDKLKALARISAEKINEVIETKTSDGQKNIKALVLFWDLLEELDQQDEVFDEVFSSDSRARIRRFVESGNQAQFLEWTSNYFNGNPKVLLQDHVRALLEIKNQESITPVDPGLLNQQELEEIEEDLGEFAPKGETESDDDFAERQQERDRQRQQKISEKATTKETELKIRALFREEAGDLDWVIKSEEKQRYETLQEEIEKLESARNDGIFALKSQKSKEGLTASQEDTLKKKEADKKEKERELNKLKGKVNREKRLTATWERRAKLFLDQGSKAQGLLDDYKKDIQTRAGKGTLHAADLAVLFSEDEIIAEETSDWIEPDFKAFLLESRDRIGDALLSVAGDIQFEADTQHLSFEDRFSSWNKQLDRYLSTGRILSALEAEDEEFYGKLLERSVNHREVSIKELIDASIQHHREAIMDTVLGEIPTDDPAVADAFVGQYHRFHEGLKSSESYQRLAARRKELEAQQGQLYQESQEVQRQLAEIFPNASWDRIWRVAGPAIDPEKVVPFLENEVDPEGDMDFDEENQASLSQGLRQAFEAFGKSRRWNLDQQALLDFWSPLLRDDVDRHFREGLARESVTVLGDSLSKDEITEAAQYNYERLAGGEHSPFPGEQLLNEIEIQVYPYRMDIQHHCEEYKAHFAQIRNSLEETPDSPKVVQQLLLELKNELIPYLRTQTEDAGKLIRRLAPDKTYFLNSYLQHIEDQIQGMQESCDIYIDRLSGLDSLESSDDVFEHFPGMMDGVDQAFLFFDTDRKTDLDQHYHSFKESQKNVPQVATFLKDELGLFDTGGREKAQAQFEELQATFGRHFETYQSNFQAYEKRMQGDMKILDEDHFTQRHGRTKAQVMEQLGELRENLSNFSHVWEKYEDPHFFSRWMATYQNPETRSEAISEFEFWPYVKEQAGAMAEVNEGFNAWFIMHQKARFDEDGEGLGKVVKMGRRVRTFTKNLNWVSIQGIEDWFKDSIELIKRISERRKEKEKADIGKALFGERGIYGLGHEFTRKATEAEEARVDEYKARYKRWSIWEMRRELYSVNSPGERDKARALIDLLVEKGQVRWDQPELWKVINMLNRDNPGAPQMKPDDVNLSQGEITQKLRDCCEAIWEDYVFEGWDGSLPGNYKSAMEKSYRDFDAMESYGDRELILSEMLEKWHRGTYDETVDPARFEGFIRKAFEAGKINGQPDPRWFYMVMAITVKNPKGETLISREMLDRLNGELLSTVPYFDFFTDKASWKKDGWIVPKGTKGAHDGAWTMEDIEAWGEYFGSDGRHGFHAKKNPTILHKSHDFFINNICAPGSNALTRVDRMTRGAKSNADHDDAEMWFAGMSFQGMAQLLNRASEGTDLVTPDFAAVFLNGFDLYMRASYEYILRGDEQYGKNDPAWREFRERRLIELGGRMRVAFGALQTIQGNYEANGQQSPLTVDQRFWEKSEDKYNLLGNKDKIEESMKELLKENGEDLDDYEEVWNFRGTRDIGENSKDRRGNERWKEINKKISGIIGGGSDDDAETSNVSYFENTSAIEKILINYGKNHGGIPGAGKPPFYVEEMKSGSGSKSMAA